MDKSFAQSPPVASINPESPISLPRASPQNTIPAPKPSRKFPFFLAGLVLLFSGIFGGFFLAKSSIIDQLRIQPKGIACTLEAKLCPDGSSVGRSGPNCEFSPCPQITTTSPSMTPDPTAGWKTYTNSQYGFSFKYPADSDSACCGISGPVIGKPEKIIVFADPKTVTPNTDKPFDGFGIYVDTPGVDLNTLEGFSSYTYGQKGSLIKNYQDMMDKEPVNTKSEFIMVSGRKGESLQGYTWWADKMIYIPFPDNKKVLVIVKRNASIGSFDAVFDQILSTFKFLDQDMGQECRVDSDCGVNICDCKAEPKQNLTPAKQACLRVCEGSVKCVNAVCVLSK